MTSEHTTLSVERRLLDGLRAAHSRHERDLRRRQQRRTHWSASFVKLGLDRHHASETQAEN